MHRVWILLAAAFSLQAGTIQGVVLEHSSGRPLSRTVVRLEPVATTGSSKGQPPLATRAGRSGQFVFPSVAPGSYLLIVAREGYFPAAYGQRLPTGRGTPIEIAADSNRFAELRLRHQGALSGRVLDENGVGAAGVAVVAYRARLPLRSSGSATSDDRGVFRIHGLEPGKYWVRSAAHTLDDGSGWLPTFGSQAREVHEARVHQVAVDVDTTDTDVIPEPGALFRLSGIITCDSLGPVIVTLSSETGRRSTQTGCSYPYRFDGLAPGPYEVFAKLQDAPPSGFLELYVDHDTEAANVQVLQLPTVDIEVRRAGSNADIPVTLIGRRQDVSETETAQEISGRHVTLAPGHWEFRARAPAGQYVESIASLRNAPRRPWKVERVSDWFDVFIEPRANSRIRISVGDQAGQIAGRVMTDSKPVPGAPVFLWPVAESTRRSVGGSRQVLSDTEGRFQFDSLPPGDYRVLASFDVNEIDEDLIEMSRAGVVRADASQTATVDLPLWVAPD